MISQEETGKLPPRYTSFGQTRLAMPADFFSKPILNTPYTYPSRHWELDENGQPTHNFIDKRRPAEFITPIPKPKKRKSSEKQASIVFDEGKGLSTQEQQYDITAIINGVRTEVDVRRNLQNPTDWQVTPETARMLQHWRQHKFNDIRPVFCQVEAVETAIWLTEVAPNSRAGKSPTGSTRDVKFKTSKPSRWETDARRCYINWVVLDSDWEAEFCRVAQAHLIVEIKGARMRFLMLSDNFTLFVSHRRHSHGR
jgi:hypothetical protein